MEDDIIRRLGLRTPLCARASFNRPNHVYQVTPKEDLDRQLRDFLAETTPDRSEARENGEAEPSGQRGGRSNTGATAQETLRLCGQGLSLQEMAQAGDLHPRTILSHLETLAEQGTVFLPERFFTPERPEEFQAAFAAGTDNGDGGSHRLRPAVEALLRQKGMELAAAEPAALSELYLEAALARLLLRQEAGQ